jgi:hypothetical protein
MLTAVLMAILLTGSIFSSQDSANAATNEYVGDNATKCALCHKAQVDAWKKWPKAKAWDKLQASKDKKDSCIPCHVTGFGKPGGFVSFEKTPKLVNVQCEACHGPAGDHMKVPLADKEKKKNSMAKPSKETCIACHNSKSPDFKEFKFDEFVKKLADHKNKPKK